MEWLLIVYHGFSLLSFLIIFLISLLIRTRKFYNLKIALILGSFVSLIRLADILNQEFNFVDLSFPFLVFGIGFSLTAFMHYFILLEFCDKTTEKVKSLVFYMALILTSTSVIYVISKNQFFWTISLIFNAIYGIFVYSAILAEHDHLIGSLRFYGVAILLLSHALSFSIFFNNLVFYISIISFLVGLIMVFVSIIQ